MAQTLFARKNLNKDSKRYYRGDLAAIDAANLNVSRERVDDRLGLLNALQIGRRDADHARIINIDLNAGLFDDRADLLTSWANDRRNLARLDPEGFDTGRVDRQ